MRANHFTALLLASAFAAFGSAQARANVITFDDLTTRDNFVDLGIAGSYQGYQWGYSNSPGLAGAVLPANVDTGWASGTVSNPAFYPAPTPVSGNSYAWNWNGPQSLIINFLTPTDVTGAYFATLSSGYPGSASTIQMFGYGPSENLMASSGVLNLTNSFQFLSANFTGVTYLEMRANANLQWFSVDNIELGAASPTPEPSSLAICCGGIICLAISRHRRKRAV